MSGDVRSAASLSNVALATRIDWRASNSRVHTVAGTK